MDLYRINPEKIAILEKSLEGVSSEKRMKVYEALDGIFQDIEKYAIIAKHSSGHPSLIENAIENTTLVAERIFNFREYLHKKL